MSPTIANLIYFAVTRYFPAVCGRLFEGSAQQMFSSLQKLMALPDNTLICCAHGYTLANLTFAHHIMPKKS